MTIMEISDLLSRVTCHALGTEFMILIEHDKKYTKYYNDPHGRIYLQIQFKAPCTKIGSSDEWKGRKWYLSDHMTPDEIIKTAYSAFEAAVKHEVMEGFKVDGKILFNPHADFEALLEASHKEVRRLRPDEVASIAGSKAWIKEQTTGKLISIQNARNAVRVKV